MADRTSNRRTNAQRCFQNCADYACARAGQCTGAGKLEDEAVTRASKQKVVAEVMRMADDAIKVLPPASQCPACGSRQCISWNSMNQDGLQNNEPSLHGGFGTTGQEPSSVQSPDETSALFTLDTQPSDLMDEHGRPYHSDMELSWRTYMGNRGSQPRQVRDAYIAAWYAGRAERSAVEPTVGTESDCSTGTGGVTLAQMAENIKLGLDPYTGSSENGKGDV